MSPLFIIPSDDYYAPKALLASVQCCRRKATKFYCVSSQRKHGRCCIAVFTKTAMKKRTTEEAQSVVKRVCFAKSVSANEAVSLSIATEADQVETLNLEWFSPKFTYHAFGTDEIIDGYDELKISVVFNGFDFRALLDVKFKNKEDTAKDIVVQLSPSLPSLFVQNQSEFAVALREAAANFLGPPGKCIESYTLTVSTKADEELVVQRHFEIYECVLKDNTPAQDLLANLQTLSLWFIEGADAVDVKDPRWILYLTYERIGAGSRTFNPVGFITVFKFFNPLGRKAACSDFHQNETWRICQALIFPKYQRYGHAERLVQKIHARAVENPHVYELTVEDPVPAFTSLRDTIDLKNCIKHEFFSLHPDASTDMSGTGRGTAMLTIDDIRSVQKQLKITQKQVHICYETRKLTFVDPHDELQCKKFRLEVKKRLFLLHREELDGMGSAERRKAFLDTEYQRLEEYYKFLSAKICPSTK